MLEFISHPAAHVVAMKAGGVVTARELQSAIDAIEAAKKEHPRISMVVEFDDMRWMTLTALLKDIGYGLTQLGDLGHYYRAAVITDKEWIKHIAHLEERLFKVVEIRTFPKREHAAAMAWAGELPKGAHEDPEEDGYHGA
ncbi:STAS/SEC14 domain-containing protein [Halomonas campisalis]|uniref:STAS/SEC14 domain-containing protein n=1 Tax=Billgrantia campisalis TaxID=74661 RepID=A0ABS9P9Z8_9GAMM|nr:STAS/SEC14 domain-containing protein [Halomonas campisalis]MCG6658593.1 STAS/SEC14 domain-containing protein [Halomonas campisalis]MDR5863455.1 STAS/SEC14 domain-containing protein [Halomonas campisalis]